jgi:hypothetical protein
MSYWEYSIIDFATASGEYKTVISFSVVFISTVAEV